MSKKKVENPPGEFSKVRVPVLGIQSSARIIANWGGEGREGWGEFGKTEKRKEKGGKRKEERKKTLKIVFHVDIKPIPILNPH